jgi:hypothetical protein
MSVDFRTRLGNQYDENRSRRTGLPGLAGQAVVEREKISIAKSLRSLSPRNLVPWAWR